MKQLIKKIEKFAIENNFSGNVSLSENGESIFSKSFGFRDIVNNLKLNGDTSMGIASGTKSFTAVAIGKLVEMEKLSFQTTMKELFKEDFSFIDSNATIHHLLNHTSGVFDYYDEETVEDFDNYHVDIPWALLETPTDYWPLFQGNSMKFKPEERVSYSNGGFILLGIIIERVSGMVYRDFMQKYIFEPIGMDSTGFYAFNDLPKNCALGYLEKDGKLISNIYNLPIRGGSDGGLYTNCSDLEKFWNGLIDGKIIKDKSILNNYYEPFTKYEDGCGYSYGIYLPKPKYGSSLVMIGGDAGVGFKSKIIIDKKLIFTVISNMSDGEEGLFELIEEELG